MGSNNTYLRRSLCPVLLVLLVGCGDYPEFSPKAYEISSALYATCRQKNEGNLGEIAKLTQAALEEGKISSREADWIHGIIAEAEAGDWESATQESRSILEAQVVGR